MKNMYELIDEGVLRDAIKNANLVLHKDMNGVSINERNTLFGAFDYEIHDNTMNEAKKMLSKCVNKINFFDTMQNINYYKDGKIFDTISFLGYRGGYKFFIGWNDGGQAGEHASNVYTDLMAAMF